MNKPKKYFGITLDPVHIGAGGYKLGRVDNTIVRDPATDVPKIPGTSLAGAIRAFAEIVKKEDNKKIGNSKQFTNLEIENVFGDGSKQGNVRFYDGKILFFPVSSIQGTVWVTTKDIIVYWLGEIKTKNGEIVKIPDKIENEAYAIKGINSSELLNLGWLLLNTQPNTQNINEEKEIVLPSKLNDFIKRIVIVSDKLFSHIVNDNLEVRTSVRIDPETGTAVEGALFTYEAIPRGTIIGFEMITDTIKEDDAKDIVKLIEATFSYLKLLGIGGMGTRGFGRVDFSTLDNDEQSNKKMEGNENDKS